MVQAHGVRRWLVTGAGGMLGRELIDVLAAEQTGRPARDQAIGLGRAELDITDAAAVRAVVAGFDVVVNAAAWTDVDGAESSEEAAHRVNAAGPGRLAAACRDHGATLVHLSTDYVFGGDATAPYPEDAPVAPRTAYGRGKAAGERAVRATLPDRSYVVRTAWLYGRHGANFVRTMLRLEAERDAVDVVADQRGQPTWARDLAVRLVGLARRAPAPGIYHVTGAGSATWCDLARAVFAEIGADPLRVRPTGTERYPRPARRPAYSVLAHDRWLAAGLDPMPPWRASLRAAIPGLRALEEPIEEAERSGAT